MASPARHCWILTLLLCELQTASSQTGTLHGQVSGWLTLHPDQSSQSQAGVRYLPEFSLGGTSIGTLSADLDLSVDTYLTASFGRNPASYEGNLKPYRLWLRLASENFEGRIGLQKISFGSATLFRPLMWFDRIDPRDPLQLTSGVYGILLRYYFLDNSNIWLWGLYGNDETKGWEIVPTTKRSIEFGGRVQSPLWTGEAGLTYHHREASLADFAFMLSGITTDNLSTPEDRYGLDGKWDLGIGIWFEAALVHQQSGLPGLRYQRQWTIGADYTLGTGNGLTLVTEYSRMDYPETPLGSTSGIGFSALSLNYPVGIVDRLSAILYRDWTNVNWYRIVTWQRTYDDWSLYVLGFWNPENIQLYQAQTLRTNIATQSTANPFAGAGLQVMIVFNH